MNGDFISIYNKIQLALESYHKYDGDEFTFNLLVLTLVSSNKVAYL